VLKLRPPMPFSAENATLATEILNRAFQNAKT
jgi:4-aminobutyrate aminotransferase-like enzyme